MMVARYERHGWEVRSVDATLQRAFVRANVLGDVDDAPRQREQSEDGLRPDLPARLPACRKLWVDARGDVQETNVPC
jgi:hypothetical protein